MVRNARSGHPAPRGPEPEQRPDPLPNTVGMQTAVPETVDRGKTHSWNVSFERRLPFVSADVAYVGNKVTGDLSRYNVNNAQTMGGGGSTGRISFHTAGSSRSTSSRRTEGEVRAIQVMA